MYAIELYSAAASGAVTYDDPDVTYDDASVTYDDSGTAEVTYSPLTILFNKDFSLRGWSFRINAPGKMVFRMDRFHAEAAETNLKPFRRVRLYRKGVSTWFGYIEAVKDVGEEIEVLCIGALGLFEYRDTTDTGVSSLDGAGSSEAFSLLTAANGQQGTGISEGTGGVSTSRDKDVSKRSILTAWEEWAAACGAEFEITADAEFNFVSTLGSDQTTLELTFRRDGVPGTNLAGIEYGVDGRRMATKIIGESSASGGLTSTYTNNTAPSEYGLLVERKTFNDAEDQGTLDALVTAYGSQVSMPPSDFLIEPEPLGKRVNAITGERDSFSIAYGTVGVGDLITAVIKTQSRDISETKRIAELRVQVGDNGQETQFFTLTEASVFITAALLDQEELRSVKQRLARLEAAA